MKYQIKFIPVALIILILFIMVYGSAFGLRDRYAQLVFPFSEEKEFTYFYIQSENALVLEVKNARSEDLQIVDRYDENLIRRVLIKEQGDTAKLRLILRDSNVRVTVNSFAEPFRIVVDLFDRYFQEARDPLTGMPLVNTTLAGTQAPRSDSPFLHPSENPNLETRGDEPIRDGKIDLADEGNRKHRLLQPTPEDIVNSDGMIQALSKVEQGTGKFWKRYPIYIYRIQTDPYKTTDKYQKWINDNAPQAMDSYTSMARYAGDLFSFGHEGKALVAYQQVLYKAPSIFEKDPMHLWKLAEIHFGRGNLILADGYYQSLIEKHADSQLANFAKLRRLDIRAIKFLDTDSHDRLPSLLSDLYAIKAANNRELRAQIAIRKAYWSPEDAGTQELLAKNHYQIPELSLEVSKQLEDIYKDVEGKWTGFLAATLLLNDKLSMNKHWRSDTGEFAGIYFDRYGGSTTDPFIIYLKRKTQDTLNRSIQAMVDQKKYLEAITVYEKLPTGLQEVKETPKTAWAIAESYRILSQPEKAISFYENAGRLSADERDRFNAYFWEALMAADTYNARRVKGANTANLRQLSSTIDKADRKMWTSWEALKDEEKITIAAGMREHLENAVTGHQLLSSPPRIVLDSWHKTLTPKLSIKAENLDDLKKSHIPGAPTVFLLQQLAKRFGELGLKKESQMSRQLLANLRPSLFDGNKEAALEWAQELVGLAEEYRQDNKYLEAGKIYALTGSESENWEGRAEALYKGGLLLYRAGQREEAIKAFTSASEDGNNLLYADLAKKRLEQIK